jgi:Arc/MetJ family transcription regulator
MLRLASPFRSGICWLQHLSALKDMQQVMRTTISVDDETLDFVMKETGAATKTEAIRQALNDYVRRRKIEKLIALKGKVRFDLDWKTLRKGWTRNVRGSR